MIFHILIFAEIVDSTYFVLRMSYSRLELSELFKTPSGIDKVKPADNVTINL